MRLRKKPWVTEAIKKYHEVVFFDNCQQNKLCWDELFSRKAPLHVELGTGKGAFISQLAVRHPEINFVGIEAQQDILYSAAQRVHTLELSNVKLLLLDIHHILDVFAEHQVGRFYINFCDPWPKVRHAKRRLTHVRFLEKYHKLLMPGGKLCFKTDNRPLFDFSLEQFDQYGLTSSNITYDLHATNSTDNIVTEYETKFSAQGVKINRCEVFFP